MPPAFLCSLSCRKNTLTFLLLLPDRLFFSCLVLFSFSYKPLKTRCKLLPLRSKRLACVSCSFFFPPLSVSSSLPFFFWSARSVSLSSIRGLSAFFYIHIYVFFFLFHLFFFLLLLLSTHSWWFILSTCVIQSLAACGASRLKKKEKKRNCISLFLLLFFSFAETSQPKRRRKPPKRRAHLHFTSEKRKPHPFFLPYRSWPAFFSFFFLSVSAHCCELNK